MLEPDDLGRLAHEVRRFLDKTDLRTRLATMPKLVLEVPTREMKARLEQALLLAMAPVHRTPSVLTLTSATASELEFGGIFIVLQCNRRFD